jgi:hypothetical protein
MRQGHGDEAVREVHLGPRMEGNQPRESAAIYEKVSRYAEGHLFCEES